MDLLKITSVEHKFELLSPVDETPTGVFLTITYSDTPEFKRLERKIRDKALKLQVKGKTFTASDIEENGLDLLVSVVKAWEWKNPEFTFAGKKNPEFNEQNVRSLLSESWVAEQITAELNEKKNFFKV